MDRDKRNNEMEGAPVTEKQPRQVSRRRLYQAIEQVVDRNNGLTVGSTVGELLEAVKDEWFRDAK